MAKPRIPNQKKQYQLLNRRLAAYMAAVRRIYGELGSEAARIAATTGYDGKKPFAWKDYPRTKARVQQLQERFVSQLGSLIMSGTSDEWRRSNLHQDLIVDKVLKAYHTSRKDARNERYYRDNSEALQAFQQRKERGMNLSDKLWDQSRAYQEELQDVISAAIERGTDAITLSKQVSKYLQDFPSMQRDYKELYGKASKAQNCEYRSIRLARSEINMAYRTAEQTRWRQLDFVVGYEIKMSGAHPAHDVCDELAGKYPKDFVWNGWHPNCMCYEVPILKTEDEFYGESDKVEPEVKGKVDAEMVEEKLDVKKTMFETHDVFKYELHPEDRAAVESFADRLGRFNPKGEVMSFGIDDVVQTQKYVGTQNVIQIAQSIENDGLQDNPTGIKVGDKVFIVDGHNRIAAMRLGGSNTFDIRVVEVSEDEWKAAGGQVPAGGFESKQRIGSTSINEVHDVPQEFKDWCTENWQRIETARKHDTLPYFLDDNKKYVKTNLTIERAAEIRHAKRDDEAIRRAWSNRQYLQSYAFSRETMYDYSDYLSAIKQARYYGIDISELENYVQTAKSIDAKKFEQMLRDIDDKVLEKHLTVLPYRNELQSILRQLHIANGQYQMKDIQDEILQFIEDNHLASGPADIHYGDTMPLKSTYRQFANAIKKKVVDRSKAIQEKTGLSPKLPSSLYPGSRYLRGEEYVFDKRFFDLISDDVRWDITAGEGVSNWDEVRTCTIYDGDRSEKSPYHRKNVIYHEGGHSIFSKKKLYEQAGFKDLFDYARREIGYEDEFPMYDPISGWGTMRTTRGNHIDNYIERILSRLNTLDERDIEILERHGFNPNDIREALGSCADLLMSIDQRYGFGHRYKLIDGKWYYDHPNMPETEFTAHCFEAKFHGNPFMKKFMPDIYARILAYVESLL